MIEDKKLKVTMKCKKTKLMSKNSTIVNKVIMTYFRKKI